MKKNHTGLILLLVLLAVVAGFGLRGSENTTLHFLLHSDSEAVQIHPYTAGEELWVFLPSWAQTEQTTMAVPGSMTVLLEGEPVKNGHSCEDLAEDTPYTITIDGTEQTLRFFRSANVPSLHLTTETGTMNKIHADKEYEEAASVLLYSPEGKLELLDRGCYLSGRGNNTWEYEKKPYRLSLSYEESLLGMAKSRKWVLLANLNDNSYLNNKLMLDLAGKFMPEWTPSCEYVDVFLNGEYAGLYLLAEKLEIKPERLDLDVVGGDFLCRIDLYERMLPENYPFITAAGRTIEIADQADLLSRKDADNIQRQIHNLENTLLSGTDLSSQPILDLDSWARKYLLDELSGNIDADLASSYFYCRDGVFYAGPCWDYDMALGNSSRNVDPQSYMARNYQKLLSFTSPYYNALAQNPSFLAAVSRIWEQELRPLVQEMTQSGILELSNRIEMATQMDRLRWGTLHQQIFSTDHTFATTAQSVREYLSLRTEFFNEVFLEGKDICTVQLVTDGLFYWNFGVERGSVFTTEYCDYPDSTWVHRDSGEVFDPVAPVLEDLILLQQKKPQTAQADPVFQPADAAQSQEANQEIIPEVASPAPETNSLSIRMVVTALSLLAAGCVFLGLIRTEIQHQKAGRRKDPCAK